MFPLMKTQSFKQSLKVKSSINEWVAVNFEKLEKKNLDNAYIISSTIKKDSL